MILRVLSELTEIRIFNAQWAMRPPSCIYAVAEDAATAKALPLQNKGNLRMYIVTIFPVSHDASTKIGRCDQK